MPLLPVVGGCSQIILDARFSSYCQTPGAAPANLPEGSQMFFMQALWQERLTVVFKKAVNGNSGRMDAWAGWSENGMDGWMHR